MNAFIYTAASLWLSAVASALYDVLGVAVVR